jgi:hypothetical protein
LKACCAFWSLCGCRGRVLRCDSSSDHNSRNTPVSLVADAQCSATRQRHRSTIRHRPILSTCRGRSIHPFQGVGDRDQPRADPTVILAPRPPAQLFRTDVIPDR